MHLHEQNSFAGPKHGKHKRDGRLRGRTKTKPVVHDWITQNSSQPSLNHVSDGRFKSVLLGHRGFGASPGALPSRGRQRPPGKLAVGTAVKNGRDKAIHSSHLEIIAAKVLFRNSGVRSAWSTNLGLRQNL